MLNAAINRVRAAVAPSLLLQIDDWGDAAHLDTPRDELAARYAGNPTVIGADLTHEYVSENADYRS